MKTLEMPYAEADKNSEEKEIGKRCGLGVSCKNVQQRSYNWEKEMCGAIEKKSKGGTGVAWTYFDVQIIFQLFFHFFLRRGGGHVGSID